jgi:hypothetical protein
MLKPGVEKERSGPGNPSLQVPQGHQRLLLSPGPNRGDGVLAQAGGVEAEVVVVVVDDSSESVAATRCRGRKKLKLRWSIMRTCEHTPPTPRTTPIFFR